MGSSGNNKNTTKAYVEDADNTKREEKHAKKLNKVRAKELRKQQKKLKTGGRGLGESDSDELPFWMQDASIRAAQAERAEEEAARKKKKKDSDKKSKKKKSKKEKKSSSSS